MASEHLDWCKGWDAVEEYDFESGDPYVRYFRGAELNVSYNCLDRHLDGPRRNKAALIWQGEPTEEVDVYTCQRLHREVCKAANMLSHLGVKRGERVVLYLPMIPQLVISMLACARLGAVHCVVFSGLSAEALKDRIDDSGAKVVVTANYGYRSGKILHLKDLCDKALSECPQVTGCVVVRRFDKRTEMVADRYVWWGDVMPGGCRLDHGALPPGLRPAGERSNGAHVRGRAELPQARQVLGGGREVRREHPVHGANGHPLDDEGRRAMGAQARPEQPALAGLGGGSPSTRRLGCGTTPSSDGDAAR